MRNKSKSIKGPTHTPRSLRKGPRKGEGKMLGTRAGTLRDWREASGSTVKESVRRRDAMRDGC